MLRNTLRWRELFDLNAAMKEEFPQELFDGLGGIHGHDKEGRPVVYVSFSDARPDRGSIIEGIIYTEADRISKPCFLMSKGSFGERRSLNEPSVCSLFFPTSWRVVQMEKCVALLNFTEIDQTVQIHGEQSPAILLCV